MNSIRQLFFKKVCFTFMFLDTTLPLVLRTCMPSTVGYGFQKRFCPFQLKVNFINHENISKLLKMMENLDALNLKKHLR